MWPCSDARAFTAVVCNTLYQGICNQQGLLYRCVNFFWKRAETSQPTSLSDRLLIMKRLASTLLYIQMADHVHKIIRADNILLFQSDSESENNNLGERFLVGFDLTRKDAGSSRRTKVLNIDK